MQTVGLNVILGADFDSAEEAMAKFRQSVDRLAAETAKAFSSMAGPAAQIGNSFKPVSDGARNATQIVINESKARQQIDKEETQAALNASKLKIQAQREESAAQRAATQAKRQEKDLYGQLVAENQALTRAYYNEAAAAIKAGDSTEATANKLKQMAAAALEGQERLKQIEAGAGRFQRNVGNYSGATQYLQQSIAQLTGEIPNFFQSMRIGFMSIGNNIQPLVQAIAGLRAENERLIAQGKETVPVLSTVIKSFLGWQTLMLVGVGIISAYGGKIVDWATGSDKTKAAAKALAEQQKELNQAFDTGVRSVSKNIVEVQSLSAEMTSSNTPLARKIDLYNQIIAQYPQLSTGTGSWEDKIKNLASTINTDLIPALRKQAVAQGFAAQAAKLGEDLAAKTVEQNRLKIKRDAARAAVEIYGGGVSAPLGKETPLDAAMKAEKAYNDNEKAVKDLNSELNNLLSKQVEVNQELQQTILKHSTYKEQLQNTVKAEQARLDVLKAGTPEFEKQFDALQKAKNALKAYDPPLKDAKTHVDALTKSQSNFNAEFEQTARKLDAGVINSLQAMKENIATVTQHLDKLFKNGGTQEAIQQDITLLQRMNYELQSLAGIDLNQTKGSLFGGNAKEQFHSYIQGIEETKKRAKELSSGFYNALGIQDPRDAVKRRDVYSQFEDMGLDASQYIDARSTPKEQAKEGENALKGLRKEYNKLESTANKALGRPIDSFVGAIFEGQNAMDALGNSIKSIVSELVAAIAKAAIFNAIISAINPAAGAAGGGFLGILGKLIPFASGGVVTGPTPALVGEAGPEAIIPLNKLGSLMSSQKVQVSITGKTRGKDLVYTGNNYNTYVAR